MAMRNLKFHEKKLLKKVDFMKWKSDQNLREVKILRRYRVQRREDYVKYNRICGDVKRLVNKLQKLDPKDPYRSSMTQMLLEKLFNMGLIAKTSGLGEADALSASAFCRRRIPVVMMRLKMAENLKIATEYIEQGHVRCGPETITDPAFLVTRNMEDYVTWVDSSKIKHTISKYNDKLDDYVMLEN